MRVALVFHGGGFTNEKEDGAGVEFIVQFETH
jgi:hypothetical protein